MGEPLVELEGNDEAVEGRQVEQRDDGPVEGWRLLQAAATEVCRVSFQGQATLAAGVEVAGQGGKAGAAEVVMTIAGDATEGTARWIEPLLYNL